jgi:hypothetical protein
MVGEWSKCPIGVLYRTKHSQEAAEVSNRGALSDKTRMVSRGNVQ